MTTDVFRECDTAELLRQVGTMNLLSISGGRVQRRETGVTLPISNGYRVTIDLTVGDTYTVRRVFQRGAKTWVKGEQTNVYAEEVGETAYRASCFRNGPWGDGVTDGYWEGK